MPKKMPLKATPRSTTGAASLAGDYLRAFAGATRQIANFDDFYEALRQLVHDDTYLAGSAELPTSLNELIALPNFEKLESTETVISISGNEGNAGYLNYRGRRDGEPFGAEDLHLMGAIAGFVSVLTAQAQQFRKLGEASRVLQYLINQLPLGVVCFDAQGDLLVESKLARRLLGDSGAELIRGALSEKALSNKGKVRMHLEVGGKLLYTEGRQLDVDEGLSITAFVLHDMSGQREKHLLQLERLVYRSESRGTPLTIAVLEDRTEAGRLYRILRASAEALQMDAGNILALDAYTCACVFTDKRLRTVRYLLKNALPKLIDRESARGALVAQWSHLDEEAPAQSLIEVACENFKPLSEVFRPALLVLDPYPAVFDALDLIGGEVASFEHVDGIETAITRINSGELDGLFLDVDTYGEGGLDWLESASEQAGGGFRVFYISHKQPSMVFKTYGLGVDTTVFQKPFDAETLRETLSLQFDFA